ncbi:glycoside hydrolase [Choiromyces venosus 120613-1]|uniref:glucan endo-1,3-beta-D-glucosidase n=1 Tax=Choiromyces venosus 120613-1 TaxID=1336337 RepID=A0A3N4JI74_9PEZI|nr:glycoside hydrolase [Choiromyces venosus 120613-1]
MSNLQRNFSFQAHDDDPAYHPLDPADDSPQRRSMAQNLQPLTGDNLARLDDGASPQPNEDPARRWEGHPAHSTDRAPHRVPSASEVSSLSAGPDEGYKYAMEDESRYSGALPNRNRQSVSRKPLPVIAAEGEEGGPANNGGENNIEANDAALLHPKPSENDPRLTPAGGYREDERYWGPELGYAQINRQSGYSAGEGEQHDNLNLPQRGFMTPGSTASPLYPPSLASPSSQATLIGGVPPPAPPAHALGTLENRSSDRVLSTPVGGHYTDNPYNRYSTTWDPVLSSTQVQVDGNADTYVLSDDEEEAHRRGVAGAAATGAASGGVLAALGSKVGRPAPSHAFGGAAAGGGGGSGAIERGGLLGGSDGGSGNLNNEKVAQSEWLRSQTKSKKKLRWVIGVILILFILGAAGGISAGVILSKKRSGGSASTQANGGGGSGLSRDDDIKQNGDLNKDSAEIKALMSNTRLKKVFHGMDYTPLNAVYPECIGNPPTQNNITRDIAVMSQLTDKLRLYGTDCNQTEMVLHAIDALKVDMKIWLGVWLDKNTTTSTRQLGHLYKLLNSYPSDRFEGIAVGNEVLFRQDLTETELFGIIDDVRHNLTALNIKLPVGTSDLGSNWKSTMVSSVDVLMANVHPFFAGVVVEKAANWTYNFFQDHDVSLTTNLATKPRVMISEVGWPSGGGNDSGSVAGISQMNMFMKEFLCTENNRGTEYFWFSAFDEPWKVQYNEPKLGKEWEDKWGLMDVNRGLKDGLEIPDCK